VHEGHDEHVVAHLHLIHVLIDAVHWVTQVASFYIAKFAIVGLVGSYYVSPI